MNWTLVLLTLTLATLTTRARGAPAYDQYDPPQYQSIEGYQQSSRGYQGPPVIPVILPGGFIADTEEVARAKESHFSAFARAASSSKYNPAEERYSQSKYNPAEEQYSQSKYNAAAAPQYSQSQPQRQQDYNVPQHRYTGPVTKAYVPSTPVVKSPIYQTQPAYSPQQKYQGPPVIPVILPSGYIAETADVEAAKQHHFELVAQAQAAVARAQERDSKRYGYSGTYNHREDDGSQYEDPEENYNHVYQPTPVTSSYRSPQRSSGRQPYQGPAAVPVVLPSGHIADTAEVTAARISHLQQLLDAAQKSLPQQRYR